MVALASSASLNSLNSLNSGSLGEVKPSPIRGTMSGVPSPGAARRGKLTKADVAASFIENLRARGSIDVDRDGFQAGVIAHFEGLPSR